VQTYTGAIPAEEDAEEDAIRAEEDDELLERILAESKGSSGGGNGGSGREIENCRRTVEVRLMDGGGVGGGVEYGSDFLEKLLVESVGGVERLGGRGGETGRGESGVDVDVLLLECAPN
jgi:hypothetical protein